MARSTGWPWAARPCRSARTRATWATPCSKAWPLPLPMPGRIAAGRQPAGAPAGHRRRCALGCLAAVAGRCAGIGAGPPGRRRSGPGLGRGPAGAAQPGAGPGRGAVLIPPAIAQAVEPKLRQAAGPANPAGPLPRRLRAAACAVLTPQLCRDTHSARRLQLHRRCPRRRAAAQPPAGLTLIRRQPHRAGQAAGRAPAPGGVLTGTPSAGAGRTRLHSVAICSSGPGSRAVRWRRCS